MSTHAAPLTPSKTPYVLGTGDDELARLGLQHRLWSDAAAHAWKLAGVGAGASVLDVGCGPGFAALDLADLVTPSGRVVGIDESERFVNHLRAQSHARELHNVSAIVADVQSMFAAPLPNLAPGTFDAAYARWVLCFTPKPADVISGVARALRPGGRFVIHDYFCYTSMTAAPRRASFETLVQATAASWRERGGDPDVMSRVPQMLASAGLSLISMRVHQRIARGGLITTAHTTRYQDPMLAWPMTWWQTFAPKLVDMGRITREQCDVALAELDQVAADPTQFIVCPPVYEMIAEKR
ncbi:MAG: methyltransferase domain-containing protein [Phycisphaerales bacterium]|nr:methyltransferase domain-containing protein [Phycisphaerales bacterium]